MDFSEDCHDDAEDFSEYEEKNVQPKRNPGSRHRHVGGGPLDLASVASLSEDSVGAIDVNSGSPREKFSLKQFRFEKKQ